MFVGIVKNVINLEDNKFLIVLRNIKNYAGKDLPGNQSHSTDSITELKILKEGDGRKASPTTSPSKAGATNGHSNGRPMGQHQHFRKDNEHLKYLHPVQVILLHDELY